MLTPDWWKREIVSLEKSVGSFFGIGCDFSVFIGPAKERLLTHAWHTKRKSQVADTADTNATGVFKTMLTEAKIERSVSMLALGWFALCTVFRSCRRYPRKYQHDDDDSQTGAVSSLSMMLQYMEWILPLTALWLMCRLLEDRALMQKKNNQKQQKAEAGDYDEGNQKILQELSKELYLFALQSFESILLPILVPYSLASTMVFCFVGGRSRPYDDDDGPMTTTWTILDSLLEWTTFVGSTMVVLAFVLNAAWHKHKMHQHERQQEQIRRRQSQIIKHNRHSTLSRSCLTSLTESNRLWGLSGAMVGTVVVILVDYQHHHLWSLPQAMTGLAVFWGLGYLLHSLLGSEMDGNKHDSDEEEEDDDLTDCSSHYLYDDVSVSVRVVVESSSRSLEER